MRRYFPDRDPDSCSQGASRVEAVDVIQEACLGLFCARDVNEGIRLKIVKPLHVIDGILLKTRP